jgi:hypothetical protein
MLMWAALSDERTGMSFTIAPGPRQLSQFRNPSPVGLVTIVYCLRFETSLFVAFYDSQGYGGGIRPRLHTAHSCRFITFCEPCRDHLLKGFYICCLCTPCAGNVFSSMVTKPIFQQRTSILVDSVTLGNVFNQPLPRTGYKRCSII